MRGEEMVGSHSKTKHSTAVRVESRQFFNPSVDVVIGQDSAVGCTAPKNLQPREFTHNELGPRDDAIGDILVRSSVLKKIPQEKLLEFILDCFKPMIVSHQYLNLEHSIELISEDQL